MACGSPDREILFRGDHNTNNEFEDANETLEDPRVFDRGDNMQRRRSIQDHSDYHTQRMTHPITVKPEPYDGSDDWEEYITQFEVCAELGNWGNLDKALTLASALRGSARTFYISLPQAERRNYGILVQRLGIRFGNSNQDSRWLSRLETRRRTTGETIAALADDLRQMAQRAYKDFDPRAQEVLALNQLYKSVSPEIKYQCKDCKTITEAVEIIERYEAIMSDPMDKRRPVRMMSQGNNEQDYETIQGLSRRMEKLETEGTNKNNSGFQRSDTRLKSNQEEKQHIRKNKGLCYICQSPNHYFSKCPIFIKCREEMATQTQTNKGISRNTPNRNQGNFYRPLTQ